MPVKAGTSKIIRLSMDVINALEKYKDKDESWDTYLRRHLGLTSKEGEPQALRTYYVLPGKNPKISLHKAELKGLRLVEQVKTGKELPQVIEVRELV